MGSNHNQTAILAAERRMDDLFRKLQDSPDFREWNKLREFFSTLHSLTQTTPSSELPRKPKDGKVMPFLLDVLRESKTPLTTRALLERATKGGFKVGGANPLRNLSARLSPHKAVKSSPDGSGWVYVGEKE